jgi:hypothetical protein
MLDSLKDYIEKPTVFVLALDEFTQNTLDNLNIEELRVFNLTQLDFDINGKVSILRGNRCRKEFIFSLTPYLIQYLRKYSNSDYLVYVDADIYFKGSPLHIINTNGTTVGIFGHCFGEKSKHLEIYGKYNVGVIYFRSDDKGLRILNWWAKKCFESTSLDLRLNPKVFGDQKYLDVFPEKFQGVCTHYDYCYGKGPWNAHDLKSDLESNASFFFHFSGLEIGTRFAVLGYRAYASKPTRSTRNFYRKYLQKLSEWERNLQGYERGGLEKKSIREWLKIIKFQDFVRLHN